MIELYQPTFAEVGRLLRQPGTFRSWPVADGALPPRPILDQCRYVLEDSPLSARWTLPFLIVWPAVKAVVGNIGGKGLLSGEEEIELGYNIAPAYRRRRIATEAIRRVVEFARADGLLPIAHVEQENEGSQRALARNGFALAETFTFPASMELQRWRWSPD